MTNGIEVRTRPTLTLNERAKSPICRHLLDVTCLMFHWEAEIAMGKMKEKELGRQREEPRLPLFIYTPKDSRVRFLAPKHTSRLLFLSEVPHSTERLGDRAEASWGQRTSVHPPQPLHDISHFGPRCQKRVYACMDVCWQSMLLICIENVHFVTCMLV